MDIIDVEHLTFGYAGRDKNQNSKVLDDIGFHINEDESVGIIGANGVGKSTLLKLMVGLLPGYNGTLLIHGIEVKKENLSEIRRRVGYVFQDSDSQLFMNTVYEDVAFAPRNYGMSEDEVRRCTMDALRKTQIEDLADRHIYRLSGGQKKLAAIATVLSMGAEILLMDEPSAALDPRNRKQLIKILKELPGIKIIASHDLDFIYDTCERTLLLADGKIVRDERTRELLKQKDVLEAHGLELPLSFRFYPGVQETIFGAGRNDNLV